VDGTSLGDSDGTLEGLAVGKGEGAGDGGLVGDAVGVGTTGASVVLSHVARQASATPSNKQRLSGLTATQSQPWVVKVPSVLVIFNLNGESTTSAQVPHADGQVSAPPGYKQRLVFATI